MKNSKDKNRMKVLLAEDETISCKALEKDIKNWGFEVIATHDGKQAWDTLHKEEISIAILDWLMPGMSGIELCKKIRREYPRDIYIILLTGKDEEDDISQGIEAGADDYMTKPFSFLDLKLRLENARREVKLKGSRKIWKNTCPLEEIEKVNSGNSKAP